MSDYFQNQEGKVCPDCRELKPVTAFSRNRARPDGLQFYCKACYSARAARAYREREARKGRAVRERVACPEGYKFCPGCRRVTPHSNWHRNATTSDGFAAYCKDCRRRQGEANHLKRTFGITVEARDALFAAQGGLCAICQTAPIKHIDHNHATNEIRGGLCGRCNMGLGQFEDDPSRLLAAARYLHRHGVPAKRVAPVIDIAYWTRPSPLEANLRRHLAS